MSPTKQDKVNRVLTLAREIEEAEKAVETQCAILEARKAALAALLDNGGHLKPGRKARKVETFPDAQVQTVEAPNHKVKSVEKIIADLPKGSIERRILQYFQEHGGKINRRDLLKATGLNPNTLSARMTELRDGNIIKRTGYGTWKLVE